MGGISAWKKMQRKRTEWLNTSFDDTGAGGAAGGQRDNYYQPNDDDDDGKRIQDENGDEMTAAERDSYHVEYEVDGHHTAGGNSNEAMGGEELVNGDDDDDDVSVCGYLLLLYSTLSFSFPSLAGPRNITRWIVYKKPRG